MRRMKTAAAILVAAGLIGVAAGCGDDDGGDTTTAAPTTTEVETTQTAPPADTTATTPADTTETAATTPADTTDTGATTEGGGDSGDLLTPDAVKSAVEGAAGITLVVQTQTGSSTVYSNAGTAVQDGSIAVVYVEEDPAAAEALAQNPPALPIPGGRATTFFYKNVFVAYAPITGDDKGADVEAAVKGL